jgi:hypothetical protein
MWPQFATINPIAKKYVFHSPYGPVVFSCEDHIPGHIYYYMGAVITAYNYEWEVEWGRE